MRLINVHTLELEEFWGREPPAYAIVSHTWSSEELSFQDWKDRASVSHKAGYHKIVKVARVAESFGLNYVWIDTNCIDKTSSAELSEAINSMFNWYNEAEWCFVHFNDVASVEDTTPGRRAGGYTLEALQGARWFTRGWTLQELIAPAYLVFLSQDWQIIGYLEKLSQQRKVWPREKLEHWFHASRDHIETIKKEIADDISHITDIDRGGLLTHGDFENQSIAVRMHWASKRQTTRVEDMAYCLLGLFKINMPLLYGEGRAAFQRLQEEIMKVSVDQSIFAWSFESLDIEKDLGRISLMAPWPSAFTNKYIVKTETLPRAPVDSVYNLTNVGLSIQLPLLISLGGRHYVAVLECTDSRLPRYDNLILSTSRRSFYRLCIPLSKSEHNDGTYRRVSSTLYPVALRIENVPPTQRLHIPRLVRPDHPDMCLSCQSWLGGNHSYVFLLFVAMDHSGSSVRPLEAVGDQQFCYHCLRVLFERPSLLPSSTQVSVPLVFKKDQTAAGGIRNKRFILDVRIDFNERRDFMRYNFTRKASFWSHVLGRTLGNAHGHAEVGLLGGQTWGHRNYREIPIFLSFERNRKGATSHQTSKTVIFRRDENVNVFGPSQRGEARRRGLDLHNERP